MNRTGARPFEPVNGEVYDPVVRSADRIQLFQYSAASFNPHRIHYDLPYAQSEGHRDLVVQGPLIGAWVLNYCSTALGPGWWIQRIRWRNRSVLLVDEQIRLEATTTHTDPERRTVDLSVTGHSEKTGRLVVDAVASAVDRLVEGCR